MSEDKFKAVGIVVVLIAVIWISIAVSGSDRKRINNWAEEQHAVSVQSIDRAHFRTGPFWVGGEDYRIYQVKLKDHLERNREVWFRFGGMFGPDIEWYDQYEGK